MPYKRAEFHNLKTSPTETGAPVVSTIHLRLLAAVQSLQVIGDCEDVWSVEGGLGVRRNAMHMNSLL